MCGSHSWRFFKTPVWHVDAARGPSTPSLDHLVGAGDERRRNFQTEGLRGFEIDDQLELGRLLDRKITRFRAPENLIKVVGYTSLERKQVRSIRNQAAGIDALQAGSKSKSACTPSDWGVTFN